MQCVSWAFSCLCAILVSSSYCMLDAAEPTRLSPENWEALVPAGKEVDAIYGDYVLANDELVAVIGDPLEGRHANLTVKNVGGALIDLCFRQQANDQLSAFFPGAGKYRYLAAKLPAEGQLSGLEVSATATDKGPAVSTSYRLETAPPRIIMTTEYSNPHDEPITVELIDALRADKSFEMGSRPELNLFWVYDDFWGQAYGVVAEDHQVVLDESSLKTKRPFLRYAQEGKTEISLAPGASHTLQRCLIPGNNLLQVLAGAQQLGGTKLQPVTLLVKDPAGPVRGARIELMQEQKIYGWGVLPPEGKLECWLPAGIYQAQVSAAGRPAVSFFVDTAKDSDYGIELLALGTVVAEIVDGEGRPVPCKVEFVGQGEIPSPFFGPDSAEHGVHNLYYSHDGKFRQEIGPGKYGVVISHGPEFDAIFTEIEVERGQETELKGKLVRSVDTSGWISADFHSHSSPSGDNTSSQLGRVLNLLCEQIEFAPCTEHARISSYVPHLKLLGVEHLLATCSGMELTGSPLPINHQNAFPLIEKPRTQNGGGPENDANPVVQIERLAMWDNASDKLVQQNHPHLYQILGDKDLDGKPDGGFEKMLGFMDVVEVHPPGAIFEPQKPSEDVRAIPNRMHAWMQMLNLGYRVPGVVNTDAHYNFHGSGPLRNYIRANDDPAQVKTLDIVHACEHGEVVLTNGPFLNVQLTADEKPSKVPHQIGEEVYAPAGKVQLLITVRCPNWLDVNRVQIFVNGRPEKSLNFTRKSSPKYFESDHATFFATIPIVLKEDAHLIVATAGEGLTLGPVMGPSEGKAMPVAVSNPIFVDLQGDGFQPNGDLLGMPLPIAANHKPSLNHSHPHHHAHDHDHHHDHEHDHHHDHEHKPAPAKKK